HANDQGLLFLDSEGVSNLFPTSGTYRTTVSRVSGEWTTFGAYNVTVYASGELTL
ncbi:MAG: hypothetical protein JNK04_10625, partial [Myxococcales bacterium]|nr:hypothetical protein [Myxococcales bacterium]